MLKAIDHIVITVNDLDAALEFYEGVLEAPVLRFGNGRYALQIGSQKINLHISSQEIVPHATVPTPGSTDLCFLTDTPLCQVMKRLTGQGVPIELGPVPRTGATGPLTSLYIRDPDGNLIEISNPS